MVDGQKKKILDLRWHCTNNVLPFFLEKETKIHRDCSFLVSRDDHTELLRKPHRVKVKGKEGRARTKSGVRF